MCLLSWPPNSTSWVILVSMTSPYDDPMALAEIDRIKRPCTIVAGMAGLGFFGLLHAFFFPGATGLSLLDIKFMVVVVPNLLLGVVVGLAAIIFAPRLRRDSEALAFWVSAALGFAGLVGAWLYSVAPGSFPDWIPVLGLLFAFIAAFSIKRPSPSRLFTRFFGVGPLIAAGILSSGIYGYTSLQHEFYDFEARPTLATWGSDAPTAPQNKPDILLISVDTLRADAVLQNDVPLPTIAAMRDIGVWSPMAVAPAPCTLPSHLSMLTGVDVLGHAVYDNEGALSPEIPTLADVFHHAGYRTVATVSNGVMRPQTGLGRGFEVFENIGRKFSYLFEESRQFIVAAKTRSWLGRFARDAFHKKAALALAFLRVKNRAADGGVDDASATRDLSLLYLEDLYLDARPFFYFLHFMDPHQPYTPGGQMAGALIQPSALPEKYRGYDAGSFALGHAIRDDFVEGELSRQSAPVRQAVNYLHTVYHEEVMFTDACIGEILERVEASGRPTVVLFTSDHGEHFGEHGLMFHNNSVHAELVHVPFALTGPGINPKQLTAPPRLEDVAPTLLSLSGINPLPTMNGRNVLTNTGPQPPFVAAFMRSLAVYDDNFKAIFDWDARLGSAATLKLTALFDIHLDSAELVNLMSEPEHRERVQRLSTFANEQVRASSEMLLAEMSDADQHILDELGY